ncbi:MAG TPA: hypothetical protein VGJ86_12145 [Acidimicrobiales bacterium]|jgi:hypothetical protein
MPKNTSGDMVAAAKGSKATAGGEAVHEAARDYEKKKKWSGSISRESTKKERTTRRSRVGFSVKVAGGIVVALVLWLTQRADEKPSTQGSTITPDTTDVAPPPTTQTAPSSPPTGAAPVASGTTCGGVPCTTLTVQGTYLDPGPPGVWIKACFDTPDCERLALADEHQQVYAVCRVEGWDVYGDTAWVKTPWRFVGPIPQDQAVAAASTGRSDPNSPTFGWVSVRYLTPRDAIEALPLCT